MISPEQLAQALDRIHPRDRELLSLSLRRRVPDEALARLYDCEPTEVARRRAGAIERVADELELQRGEDLGAVLKSLLEPATWSAVSASVGDEFAMEAGGARLTAAPTPENPKGEGSGSTLAAVPESGPSGTDDRAAPPKPPAPEPSAQEPPSRAAAPRAGDGGTAPRAGDGGTAPRAGDRSAAPPPSEPVREMFAAREREVPDPPRRAVPLALLGLAIALLIGAAAVLGATQFGDTNRVVEEKGGDGTRHFVPAEGGTFAAPFPTDPQTTSCYSTAYVSRPTVLYREPGGAKRLRITAKTEWGSPRVLGVLEQRGDWLGVQAAELRNGEVAWVHRERARVDCVRWSLHADLSKRTLFVRRDGRTVRKMRVAIGRRSNPTPEGRFTVTDKLRVTGPDSPYGCCVLALSGHQTNLPEYWPGGDRLAVHATSDESSIGQPVSLGCLRTESRRARWLIETVPLGAPIFIRA